MKKQNIFGILAAFFANSIFGLSFMFSKMALSVAKPYVILSVRFVISFITLSLLIILKVVKVDYRGKPKLGLLLMGLAQPFLYFVFETNGMRTVSSSISGIIISLVPVAVMIICFCLGEKPTLLQVVCTFVSIGGIAVISLLSSDNSKSKIIGIILLIGAVVSSAAFNVLSQKEAKRFTATERTYAMFIIGAVGFIITGFLTMRGSYISEVCLAFKSTKFVIAELYLSVLSSVLAFILYNYSTSVISVVQTASFANMITVVSVAAGVLILKEEFSLLQLFICIIIILGVWGVNVFTPERKKAKQKAQK